MIDFLNRIPHVAFFGDVTVDFKLGDIGKTVVVCDQDYPMNPERLDINYIVCEQPLSHDELLRLFNSDNSVKKSI